MSSTPLGTLRFEQPLELRQRPRLTIEVVGSGQSKAASEAADNEYRDAIAALLDLQESSGWRDFLVPVMEAVALINYVTAQALTFVTLESPQPFMRWIWIPPSTYHAIMASHLNAYVSDAKNVNVPTPAGRPGGAVAQYNTILASLGRDPQTGRRVEA